MQTEADLVDDIYEAAIVPERWPRLLDEIARRHDAALGSIFTTRPDGTIRWIGTDAAAKLFAEFQSLDPPVEPIRLRRAAELELEGFYTDLDLGDPSIFEHPAYTQFLYPRNYGWFAAATFQLPNGDSAGVGFERYRDRGPFEPSAIDSLNDLRPHLGRAAVLSVQAGLQRAQSMAEALNTVGIPGAVLNTNGQLFVANARFEALMPAVVADRRHRVCLTNSRADELLRDAIERLRTRGAPGQSRSIPVAARDDRPPLIFHIVPVRGAAHDIFSQGLAILTATPVDRSAVPAAEVLQVLFDLTPAEARVARAIAQGKSVEAIAIANGVSRETVRTQLVSILRKTGLNRQAELVALLGGKALPET